MIGIAGDEGPDGNVTLFIAAGMRFSPIRILSVHQKVVPDPSGAGQGGTPGNPFITYIRQ
jgi:hypothetical protein